MTLEKALQDWVDAENVYFDLYKQMQQARDKADKLKEVYRKMYSESSENGIQ